MRLSGTRTSSIHQYRGLGDQLWDLGGARPTLDLNFAHNKSLVDSTTGQNLITFTRASSGTYVDSAGVIQTATNDVPRFDHNPTTGESLGLLVEEARTNLLLQSEDFSTTWTLDTGNPTLSTNSALAPNGTTTADKLVEGITNGGQDVLQAVSIPSTGQYTYSVYAKAAERFKILLRESTFTGAAALYDLSAGSVAVTGGGGTPSPSASIQSLANGWYRCQLTMNQSSTGNRTFRVFVVDDAETTLAGAYANRAGDGTSGLYLWGAQLELAAFPTSYIPTTTATVTRAADVATITGSNFSSWYNQTEGTMFSDAIFSNTTSYSTTFNITSGTSAERFRTLQWNDGTSRIMVYTTGGVTVASLNGTSVVGRSKNIGAYKVNDFAGVANGGSVLTDTAGALSTLFTFMEIGSTASTFVLNGPIRRLTYWPTRLSDTTLQRVTQ